MSKLNAPHFQNDESARKYLEAIRWPSGPVCPHCGTINHAYALKGGKHRCGSKECRKDFSVTVGTVYERSHIPLHKWLLASYLLCSSKKGISSKQLERMLDVTYKTAWFMTHRIREAMKPTGGTPPLGGKDATVEADETYFSTRRMFRGTTIKGGHTKMKAVTLVERGGTARSIQVDDVHASAMNKLLREHIRPESHLMTDSSRVYSSVGKAFASHESVNHTAHEYGRGDAHTNTVEGYFSIFKRGMKGVYQHCGEQHLQRYLAEFDFRYSHRSALGIEDTDRTILALRGIEGKRLTYRQIGGKEAA